MPSQRHVSPKSIVPAWVRNIAVAQPCLASVAEEAYVAERLAIEYGADDDKRCATLMAAARQSLRRVEDRDAPESLRCMEGDRAVFKFWEAKLIARMHRRGL